MNSVSNQKVLFGGKTKKTTKCPKNCKCTKCAKKASMKKVAKKPIVKKATTKKTTMKKKVVKGGAKKLIGVTNLGKVWNDMFKKKIKSINTTSNKFSKLRLSNINNVNSYNTSYEGKKYVLFVIDMQRDFCDVPYERSGKVRLVSKKIKRFNRGTKTTREFDKLCRVLGSETKFQRHFTTVEKNEKHSVTDLEEIRFDNNGQINKNGNAIGNFNVADSGEELTQNLVSKITYALGDENCTQIIFTRDYHPDGHMSFCPVMTQAPYIGCEGGCFPAHCIQGHSGTLFVQDIQDLLLSTNPEILENKVKILFKGMSDNCDSFTGVKKTQIDNYCSNTKSNKSCSSISGAYEIVGLSTKEAITFNNPVNFTRKKTKKEKDLTLGIYSRVENNKNISPKPFDYTTIIENADEFQVCGLAGDYCVRDTITALADEIKRLSNKTTINNGVSLVYNKQKILDKRVVLLADLTRYAVLPLKSMLALPIHNYSGNMLKPKLNGIGYDLEFEAGKLTNGKLTNFDTIKEYFTSIDTNKSLYYYLLTNTDGKYSLVKTKNKRIELSTMFEYKNLNLNKGNLTIKNDFTLTNPVLRYFHFITPPEEIAKDYSYHHNIVIRFLNNPSSNGH